jgi:hypothetical protein
VLQQTSPFSILATEDSNNSLIQGNVGMAEIHEGMPALGSVGAYECGAALPSSTMVLDSWNLTPLQDIP